MADLGISQSTAMATYMSFAACVVVFVCIFGTAHSEHHKKKIIVKVPHLIRHIHHSHYKPIHIHKLHTKSVDHHHHETYEEPLGGWEYGSKGGKGKYKAHGSFSQLRPVVAHQNADAYTEYAAGYGHGYGQEDAWTSESNHGKRRSKQKGENGKWKPLGLASWTNEGVSEEQYSGEKWNSGEDSTEHRGEHEFSSETEYYDKNKQKSRQMSWRDRHHANQDGDDGWKPIVNFKGWKDVSDLRQHSGAYHHDQFIHSGEDQSGGGSDEKGVRAERVHVENNYNSKKKQKKNKKKNTKKTKWSKQIEVREPNNEGEHQPFLNQPIQHQPIQQQHIQQQHIQQQPIQQQPIQQLPIQQPQYGYQTDRHVPVMPQLSVQPYQDLHLEQQPMQPQPQPTSWPLPAQQPQKEPKRWSAIPQQQQTQWPENQPSAIWYTQPSQQPQPTQPSKVIWSGHHLQLPQQTMWQVQQHSVQSVPVSVLPASQKPLPPLPSFVNLNHLQEPSQSQQASSHMHHVLPPVGWPLTQNPKTPNQHSPVKQHWEQSVHTSTKDGPASSYKVEVINYANHKDRRQ